MFYYKFKFFFKVSFFLIASLFVAGCFPPPEGSGDIARVIKEDDTPRSVDSEDGQNLTSQTRCNRRDTYSEEVSIRNLEFVDSGNVGEYLLKGRCEEDDELVYVTVNGYRTSLNPKCDKGRWEMELDLTPVATEESKVVFSVTHNRESICKSVRLAFLGPENYIPVPPNEKYYDTGFYVMKYEAKVEGRDEEAKAVSKPEGRPAIRVTHREALKICQNNGSRYDLMNNLQWQNIARSIEEVGENWSQGRATPSDSNTLNCGLLQGNPQPASSDDEDDCATSSCDSGWDQNRRTHLLSNGARIWDICGGAGEIMEDKYRESKSFDDFVYELTSSLKRKFGPSKTYRLVSANRRSNTWGLGYANIEKDNDLIIRGMGGRHAGIFSVDVTHDQVHRRGYNGNVGFRCVYIP